MKFTCAALAAVASAEQMYGFKNLEAGGPYPSVTTPLSFIQTSGQENFQILMDQTKGVPDPPQLNADAVFDVSGTSTHPIEIAQLEFQCFLFGAKVYDEKFDQTTPTANPGTVWTSSVTFPVPPVAPSTEYDIQINGLDASGNTLWTLTTAFNFA